MDRVTSARTGHFGRFTFWAEQGRVHIRDEYTGETHNISPETAMERAVAIWEQAERAGRLIDERDKFLELRARMERVARDAAAQGDPGNPAVRDYRIRHKDYIRPMSPGVRLSPGGIILP